MSHCEAHNILANFQHGFRKGKNIDMLILDFSKAFDTVPHKRLITKLKYYGISCQVGEWIQAWLTKRQQQVVLDGDVSSPAHVRSGVPQGTVLGPLMFLLYINDINEHISSSQIRLFADDCLLYREVRNENDVKKLQDDLTYLEQWAKVW